MKICNVAQIRELDRSAVKKYCIDELLLMENAGSAAASVVAGELGDLDGKKIAVICGGGNNGGDGFVIARHLLSGGAVPRVILGGDPSRYQGAAKKNYEIAQKLPLEIVSLVCSGPRSVVAWLDDCDAVVDALLGTGLDRIVQGGFADVIAAINESGKKVFSVDIPSGVNGDTGKIMGTAVRADATITFGLLKTGSLLYPGYTLGGRLYLSHISFPRALYESDTLKIELNQPASLPARNPAGHKGDFGDTLFIAGAASYYGAPFLSASAFLKAGGGYSRLAAPRSMVPSLALRGSEVVYVPQEETLSGSSALSNLDSLLELSEIVDFVVLGPGLSLDEETQKLAVELTRRIAKPLLIDGDGITALCADLSVLRNRTAPTVLTPHAGEMARITGKEVSVISDDPISCLQETMVDLQCTVVLKGARSLIGYAAGNVLINVTGNSGMATAGSGDVLTGTIAAMYGLGLPFEEAVAKGVFMHGFAGDLAAEDMGEDGLTAADLLDYLPEALRLDRQSIDEHFRERYPVVTVL